jgi:hypothetical protein
MDTDKLDAFGRPKDPADALTHRKLPAKGETYDVGGTKTDALGQKVAAPAKKTRAKAEPKAE